MESDTSLVAGYQNKTIGGRVCYVFPLVQKRLHPEQTSLPASLATQLLDPPFPVLSFQNPLCPVPPEPFVRPESAF